MFVGSSTKRPQRHGWMNSQRRKYKKERRRLSSCVSSFQQFGVQILAWYIHPEYSRHFARWKVNQRHHFFVFEGRKVRGTPCRVSRMVGFQYCSAGMTSKQRSSINKPQTLHLILIRHLSMLPQAPRAWQTPTSWSIHSGMVLGSLHYGGFFDLTPPRGRG